jgi:hypothetical protein
MYHHFTTHTSNLLVWSPSAVAGYIVPDTDELVNAALATSMTLVGALCFLWAARILVKPPPWLLPATR